jgi:hypothetical protein
MRVSASVSKTVRSIVIKALPVENKGSFRAAKLFS